jgi:hypothetical protein
MPSVVSPSSRALAGSRPGGRGTFFVRKSTQRKSPGVRGLSLRDRLPCVARLNGLAAELAIFVRASANKRSSTVLAISPRKRWAVPSFLAPPWGAGNCKAVAVGASTSRARRSSCATRRSRWDLPPPRPSPASGGGRQTHRVRPLSRGWAPVFYRPGRLGFHLT